MYRWNNSQEWLIDYVKDLEDEGMLKSIIFDLVKNVDPDTIQDLFQNAMEIDGYFEKKDV